MTDFARTETCNTHTHTRIQKKLQNLPKKLASNDAEDLLCSLFLSFLSFFFFFSFCVSVCRVHFKQKNPSLFLTVVHPHSLCSWEDRRLCCGRHSIFKEKMNLRSVGCMFVFTDGDEKERLFAFVPS